MTLFTHETVRFFFFLSFLPWAPSSLPPVAPPPAVPLPPSRRAAQPPVAALLIRSALGPKLDAEVGEGAPGGWDLGGELGIAEGGEELPTVRTTTAGRFPTRAVAYQVPPAASLRVLLPRACWRLCPAPLACWHRWPACAAAPRLLAPLPCAMKQQVRRMQRMGPGGCRRRGRQRR